MRKPSLLWLLGLVVAWAPGPATAQGAGGPRYVASQPAPGAFLHAAPSEVSITFSEPLGEESTMSVSDECGRPVDDGAVALDDNRMQVGLASGPAGEYTVSYIAHGEEDSSGSVPGSFSFTVHQGPDCGGGGGRNHGGHGHGDGSRKGREGEHTDEHDPSGEAPHGTDHRDSSDHVAATHMGTEHVSGDTEHTKHGKRKEHKHRDRAGKNRSDPARPGRNITVGDRAAAAGPAREATRGDLLLALGLAGAFGALGGLILRFSSER